MSSKPQLEPGAPVAAGFIPLAVPELGGNAWEYVKECLDTNWVSSVGPFVDRFEQICADYLGARYAVATVNGTAALQVALRVAGVEPGDAVLVSALTFIAPANAVRYLGACPVFMDADPETWQMDPGKVEAFLRAECERREDGVHHPSTGRRVRAIVPVHLLGHPVDIDPIRAAAREFGLPVIEDNAESLGARYRGRMVGRPGDIACLSFNGNKTITTGGGGMLVTDDEAMARRARHLTTQAKSDPLEYIHDEIGYNFRLTNLQAALGCAQMEVLEAYVAKKRAIAARYADAFRDLPGITLMPEAPWATCGYWLSTVLVDPDAFGMDARALLSTLGEQKIQTRPLWQPLHRSPAHADAIAWRVEVADAIYARALSLPSSVGLTEEVQARVIAAIRAAATC